MPPANRGVVPIQRQYAGADCVVGANLPVAMVPTSRVVPKPELDGRLSQYVSVRLTNRSAGRRERATPHANLSPMKKDTKCDRQSSWLHRLVRRVYLWKYGCRGGIKPPLGFVPWGQPTITQQVAYQYRVRMWRMESAIYDSTGLPDEWLGTCETLLSLPNAKDEPRP
jgi:hypothetical protein